MSNKDKFKDTYNLTEDDIAYLWKLFMDYGHPNGVDKHRSSGNHYFLQGIGQWCTLEYNSWKSKMTKELKDIIKEKYPQLMVNDWTFDNSRNKN